MLEAAIATPTTLLQRFTKPHLLARNHQLQHHAGGLDYYVATEGWAQGGPGGRQRRRWRRRPHSGRLPSCRRADAATRAAVLLGHRHCRPCGAARLARRLARRPWPQPR